MSFFEKKQFKVSFFVALALEDGLTGSAWGDWSLYTASPLRGGESTSYASFDPAKELDVQDPIGIWDPLGLSADKDEATFKQRRAVKIKHGRIVRIQVVLNRSVCWKFRWEAPKLWFTWWVRVIRTCIRLCDLIFRPCTQPLVALYLSTTSSLATSLLVWDWSSQMCPMALLLCPSVELSCEHEHPICHQHLHAYSLSPVCTYIDVSTRV